MISYSDYPRHRNLLKKCNTFYNGIFKFYIVLIVFMILLFVPNLLTSLANGGNLLVLLLLAVVLIPCNIAMAMYSMYTKTSKFAFYSIIPAALGLFTIAASVPFYFGLIDVLLLGLSIALAVLVPKVNKTYDYLSQQEGFPLLHRIAESSSGNC